MFSRALLIEGAFQRNCDSINTVNFSKKETDVQEIQWSTLGDLDKYSAILLVEVDGNED